MIGCELNQIVAERRVLLMAEIVGNLETETNSDDEQFTFVVHGAVIACEHGSHLNYLNLPKSHCVFVKKKAIASVSDHKSKNIPTFGVCLKQEEI